VWLSVGTPANVHAQSAFLKTCINVPPVVLAAGGKAALTTPVLSPVHSPLPPQVRLLSLNSRNAQPDGPVILRLFNGAREVCRPLPPPTPTSSVLGGGGTLSVLGGGRCGCVAWSADPALPPPPPTHSEAWAAPFAPSTRQLPRTHARTRSHTHTRVHAYKRTRDGDVTAWGVV
jgi:hypothetical protein